MSKGEQGTKIDGIEGLKISGALWVHLIISMLDLFDETFKLGHTFVVKVDRG